MALKGISVIGASGSSSFGALSGVPADNAALAAELAAKQNQSGKLDAVSAVGASAGVIENVSGSAVAVRPFGVAAATSIPTRADVDSRFPRFSTGTPTGGVSGDITFSKDDNDFLHTWKNTGGVWARHGISKTFAELVALIPSAFAGQTIFCSTFNVPLRFNGTYWEPLNKYLLIAQSGTPTAATVGTGAQITYATDTIPAGLVKGNCRIRTHHMYDMTGTAAVKTPRCIIGGVTVAAYQAPATHNHYSTQQHVFVDADGTTSRYVPNAAGTSQFSTNTGGISGQAINYGVDVTVSWTCLHTSPDTASMVARSLEIFFP